MLTEAQYYASPGATVCIWLTGVDDLYAELHRKRAAAWSPAVWVPAPEPVPWGARVMTIVDPFGNHLLFAEPLDPRDQDLPGW